jgi:hypothetical protein
MRERENVIVAFPDVSIVSDALARQSSSIRKNHRFPKGG